MTDEKKLIDTGTWAGMVASNMSLSVYCSPCNRYVDIDMSLLPPDECSIGRKFRCRQCGARGQCIVSPPRQPLYIPPDFYGKPSVGPRPDPITKRRRRRR